MSVGLCLRLNVNIFLSYYIVLNIFTPYHFALALVMTMRIRFVFYNYVYLISNFKIHDYYSTRMYSWGMMEILYGSKQRISRVFGYNSAWASIVLHSVVCLYRLSSSVTRVGGRPPPDRVQTGRYVHSTLISLFCMDLMLLQLVFSFRMSLSIVVKTQRLSGLHCASGAVYFWLASIDHSD